MSVVTQANSAFQARSLLRSLLRQSRQFAAYNFREYARRRTIDAFRESQHVTEERKIQELMQKGLQDLRMMKRQTIISQFYQLDKLVVEGEATGKESGSEGGILRQKDTGLANPVYIYRTFFSLFCSCSFHGVFSYGRFRPSGGHPSSYICDMLTICIYPTNKCSSQFRSSRRSQALTENVPNRTRTGQVDHDVFEGFPVRRWVRQPVVVYQNPKIERADTRLGGSQALPELPMPRDSHLLTPMSRALLRAARAGCKYIRPAPTEVEDDEKEIKDADEPVAAPPFERTFTAGKWTLVPRHIEPPEAEFLAKRRAGLSSLYGSTAINGTAEVQPEPKPTMRKTKFKKVDPTTGNVSIYEAWVPEGHKVEGEITENTEAVPENSDATVVEASPAPGTVVEGVGVVDTQGVVVAETDSSMIAPIKKKHPPPKRKAKGIGKGRRKKVMFAPGEGETAPTTPGGTETAGDVTMSGTAQDGSSTATPGLQDDDEDEDEENEGEESDEGEESAPESKSPGTVIKSEQDDSGNTPTVPEKEELNLDIHEQSSLPRQEQHEDAAFPPTDKPNSPELPPAADTTTLRPTEPPDETIPPSPQSQPQTPAPIKMPSPRPVQPVSNVPEPTEDISFSDEQPQLSESANNETKAPANNQNGTPTPREKSRSPIDDVKPDSATQPFHPQENPSSATTLAPHEPHSATVRFENGEVDLLGSLEASLDNPSKIPTARNHNHVSPTAEDGLSGTVDASEQDTSVRENDERRGSSDEKKDVEMTG
ncbi:hypothetical protein GX51_00649 [Blastomyces parvus]|uniref:Complex 1 LYR protein domain-containing protein n=1 Tax=Blastomyces parvus TaxID=2060905 RepID=A0A2B7XL75_9EURO|nr:hypothetical protein GX51_00649 [Blastomyces parvus]